MACIDDKGQLSKSAKNLLRSIMEKPLTPLEISQATKLPLFKVKSSLREMKGFKLIKENEGYYEITQKGSEVL